MKTGDPEGLQSSNLCASARLNKGVSLMLAPLFFLCWSISQKKQQENSTNFLLKVAPSGGGVIFNFLS
ncbi:hypothetical protein DRM25_19605 [Salmonella enterica subsp. houtenae]|nr:hypothetical protein [Salmonella enterica subsp. houtenae]ECI4807159.1 hypothetical protein [Salmonella enterica subsp. houtenae]